ncbi:NADPH:quinone reductase [Sinomonas terrae]|uniref:NADPH:quinone reductase n=1 Tax=Sinomonas terrae TaxID=2908838 RepID=A0ABS9U731_9MICC|nr:NADPH:quinone reductase [Sinomonas terrae]MCH6472508.1 NADPH:quinone reductase [Sinomonas terrae]
MRAAYVRGLGGPDAIEVGELPVPDPGPTEALVRAEALAVDRVDAFVRSGAYRTPTPFPFVIGRDVVGVVEQAGEGSGFAEGERVWSNSLGHGGRQGSFAQFCLVPGERLYRLPEGVDPWSAVGVLHTGATAALGLFRRARLRPGDTVFIAGAGGGVGSAAVQLAAAAGLRVLASCSGQDAGWCRSCGAGTVLDYRDPEMPARLALAAPEGIDLWWDQSGRQDLDAAPGLLRTGATVLVTAGIAAWARIPLGALYTKDVRLVGFAISNASAAELADAALVVNRALSADRLRFRTAATLGLSESRHAHELLEAGGLKGRILIDPSV